MPSHMTTGIILVIVVVSVVCIIAFFHYHQHQGKKISGPSRRSQNHTDRTSARSTRPPSIVPSLRTGVCEAPNSLSRVASLPSHNRPLSGKQAMPPDYLKPTQAPQPAQPAQPTQPPQPPPKPPVPAQAQVRPPARIIIPPPVAGGLYGLKGVFPQPKRGGR